MPPVLLAAGLAAAGGVAGSLISSHAAKSAAQTQADAANHAADIQKGMFDTTRGDLLPNIQAGQTSQAALMKLLGLDPESVAAGVNPLTSPLLKGFSPTQAQLETTPGYQFSLTQGLKAVNNSASARGLGGASGALGKGIASYATGLADNTFQHQFQNWMDTQNAQYNRLTGPISLGENAAAQSGNLGVQTGANIGNSVSNAGTALASGQVGSANALAGGLGNLSSLFLANNLLGGKLFGGGGGAGSSAGSSMYGNMGAGDYAFANG